MIGNILKERQPVYVDVILGDHVDGDSVTRREGKAITGYVMVARQQCGPHSGLRIIGMKTR